MHSAMDWSLGKTIQSHLRPRSSIRGALQAPPRSLDGTSAAAKGHRTWTRTGVLMNQDYKIYVDASRPATLNNGAGALTDCATLQEAVLAWQRLAPEQKIRATVKVIGGPVYTAKEIERLHYGPKPA